MLTEFDLIARYFTKTPQRQDVSLSIGDDCALVQMPANHHLAITTDSLVEAVHFPQNTLPEHLGHKAMAVNLSDLAAMGATPAWVTLALTLPAADSNWLKKFARGFFQLLNRYEMQLIGGDTCQGPLSITVSAYGFIPNGQALLRSGAKPGDKIYVTGTLGDAALALQSLQGKLQSPHSSLRAQRSNPEGAYLQQRLNCPEPRIAAGLGLRRIASAAIDISDGLLADLTHILTASKVGASLNLADLPQSKTVQALIKAGEITQDQFYQSALTGGDDYELCFTIPAAQESVLKQNMQAFGCDCSCIGVIEAESGLRIYDSQGCFVAVTQQGFRHF
ncbi:thiamine-phosphate kinase [soil metagenome]